MRNVSRAGQRDGADVVLRPRVAAAGRGDWVHDEAEKCGAIGGLPSHASCDIVSPSQSGTGLAHGCRDPNAIPIGQMIIGRGCSSVVERHVANVNVEGSTPFTRFLDDPVPRGAGLCLFVPKVSEISAFALALLLGIFSGGAFPSVPWPTLTCPLRSRVSCAFPAPDDKKFNPRGSVGAGPWYRRVGARLVCSA